LNGILLNRKKIHESKVSFERAANVLLDSYALSIEDEERSEEEDRRITLGMDKNGVLLVVIHTFREIDPDNYNIRDGSLIRDTG